MSLAIALSYNFLLLSLHSQIVIVFDAKGLALTAKALVPYRISHGSSDLSSLFWPPFFPSWFLPVLSLNPSFGFGLCS
ncbi:MAG: hypothetical protein ACKVRP_08375 [Bacteroidota bacterium]